MCEVLKSGTRCTGSHGEAVFAGEFWVTARLFERLEREPQLRESLSRGFCTLCHRQWADTHWSARCCFCGVGMRLDGVKGVCPSRPADGTRVVTQFGEAVFNGYCWTEAWLYDYDRDHPEPADDDPYGLSFELGGCSGCGAYWGNCIKCVRCVFCGTSVSLT